MFKWDPATAFSRNRRNPEIRVAVLYKVCRPAAIWYRHGIFAGDVPGYLPHPRKTLDEHFYDPMFDYHWSYSGFGLNDSILEKLYRTNAVKISAGELTPMPIVPCTKARQLARITLRLSGRAAPSVSAGSGEGKFVAGSCY